MSLAAAHALAGRGAPSAPGTCKIDISAQVEACVGTGVEVTIGKKPYHVDYQPDYVCITPTPEGEGDYGTPDHPSKPGHGGHGPDKPGHDEGYSKVPKHDDKKHDDGYGHDKKDDGYGGGKPEHPKPEQPKPEQPKPEYPKPEPGPSPAPPSDECREPTLSLNLLDLVDLDLFTGDDISLFAEILGIDLNLALGGSLGSTLGELLENVGSTLGDLLNGLLGGGRRDRKKEKEQEQDKDVRDQFDRDFDVECGKAIGGDECDKTTADDLHDCLARCEAEAVELTLELGEVFDCAGVSFLRGVRVDNCLFVAGNKALDLSLNLGTNEDADSLIALR